MAFALLCSGPAFAQESGTPNNPGSQPPVRPPVVIFRPELPGENYREAARRQQFDIWTKISDPSALIDRYETVRKFAECAQRVTPSRVTALLSQPISSSGERRAASSLMRFAPGCLGHAMTVSTRYLRGAAAEAVLRNYKTGDPDEVKKIDSDRLDHYLKATPSADRETNEMTVALARYTGCQVLFAPGLVRKLIETKPDSPKEKTLRQNIGDLTKACGAMKADSPAAGLFYRSFLAESLYHWTRSNGDSDKS